MKKAALVAKARGTSIVLISHRPGVLSIADKILILRKAVAAYGNADDVLNNIMPD